MKNLIKNFIKNSFPGVGHFMSESLNLQRIAIMNQVKQAIMQMDPDSLIGSGFAIFSQVDEDGLIETIYRDIGEGSKIFVEIGCGNGLENNSHYLVLKGWRGIWVDGSEKNISFIQKNTFENRKKLLVEKFFVTPQNVYDFTSDKLGELVGRTKGVDFLSVDIDSCDYEIVNALIKLQPRVLCCEINPNLGAEIDMHMNEGDSYGWDKTIYQGTSLFSLNKLLSKHGYGLVCCSVSGYNAFFVKIDLLQGITVRKPDEVIQPPRKYLVGIQHAHEKSFGWLNKALKTNS